MIILFIFAVLLPLYTSPMAPVVEKQRSQNIYYDKLEKIRECAQTPGFDINALDKKKNTFLILTTAINARNPAKEAIINELLSHPNIDIDHQNIYGNTALIFASTFGEIEIVKKLVERGANPFIKNLHQATARDWAANPEIKYHLRSYEVFYAQARPEFYKELVLW